MASNPASVFIPYVKATIHQSCGPFNGLRNLFSVLAQIVIGSQALLALRENHLVLASEDLKSFF